MIASFWNVDQTKILTHRELACVLDDLAHRAPRSASMRMNRVIFRLSSCAGLHVSEAGACGSRTCALARIESLHNQS